MASSKDPQKLHDRKKKEKQTALLWRLRARAPVQKIYLGTTSAEVDDNKDGPKRQELLGASIWRRIMTNNDESRRIGGCSVSCGASDNSRAMKWPHRSLGACLCARPFPIAPIRFLWWSNTHRKTLSDARQGKEGGGGQASLGLVRGDT